MYFYCLVNPGFESKLKQEAAAHTPDLHPSFSRPGLVTFKATKPRQAPRFTFARVCGSFVGKGTSSEAALAVQANAQNALVHRYQFETGATSGAEAPVGSKIFDVLELAADVFWWGTRTVDPWGWGCPAGLPQFTLPDLAPSRAWLKLEEMLAWSRWSPQPGTQVLELGSAPGGASWALLNRGASVVGVDVAPMAEVCANHPQYTHLSMSIRELRKKDLPPQIEVLFCDLGLKPVEAVPQIRHLCQILPSINRIYYTLKMGEGQTMLELDRWRDALRQLGFSVRSTHLPSNRMEILMAGTRESTSPRT